MVTVIVWVTAFAGVAPSEAVTMTTYSWAPPAAVEDS